MSKASVSFDEAPPSLLGLQEETSSNSSTSSSSASTTRSPSAALKSSFISPCSMIAARDDASSFVACSSLTPQSPPNNDKEQLKQQPQEATRTTTRTRTKKTKQRDPSASALSTKLAIQISNSWAVVKSRHSLTYIRAVLFQKFSLLAFGIRNGPNIFVVSRRRQQQQQLTSKKAGEDVLSPLSSVAKPKRRMSGLVSGFLRSGSSDDDEDVDCSPKHNRSLCNPPPVPCDQDDNNKDHSFTSSPTSPVGRRAKGVAGGGVVDRRGQWGRSKSTSSLLLSSAADAVSRSPVLISKSHRRGSNGNSSSNNNKSSSNNASPATKDGSPPSRHAAASGAPPAGCCQVVEMMDTLVSGIYESLDRNKLVQLGQRHVASATTATVLQPQQHIHYLSMAWLMVLSELLEDKWNGKLGHAWETFLGQVSAALLQGMGVTTPVAAPVV